VNLAESITKKFEASADSCEASFYALRAFLWSCFRPQTPTGATMSLSGSHQPTPDPSFSLFCYQVSRPWKEALDHQSVLLQFAWSSPTVPLLPQPKKTPRCL